MRMNARRMVIAVACVVCVSLALSARPCRAGDPAEPGRSTLDKLLKAVEANDYDSFVADASDVFKAALTKPMLQGVSGQLAPRLKNGVRVLVPWRVDAAGLPGSALEADVQGRWR